MGNMQCPAEDAALLASVARDICPFPNYNPNPVYFDMLSLNSSLHLRNHYAAVQSSLTPQQLEDFTQGLRTTFGREGRVTLGGVGVVALSLAVLFDTLARQVKGESVPESGPIPNLFINDPRGDYPPGISVISDYLRLVPHMANNPTRMKEETKRYFRKIMTSKQEKEKQQSEERRMAEDVPSVNFAVVQLIQSHMRFHLHRIANSSEVAEVTSARRGNNPAHIESKRKTRADESHVGKTRVRRIPSPETSTSFSLNCNPEEASVEFLAEIQKSNHTMQAGEACKPRTGKPVKTWLHHIAALAWMDFVNSPVMDIDSKKDSLIDQRGDFDLKEGALIKWMK